MSATLSTIPPLPTPLPSTGPIAPVGLSTRIAPPAEVEPYELRSLSGIEDLDAEEMVVTALAATPVDTVARAAAEEGLVLCPLFPIGTEGTLGGLYSSGFESPTAPTEGQLRDAVLGIEGWTGGGAPLRSGGRVVKNVTGYDLTRYLCGARGTLGIVTRLHWRLRRAPVRFRELVGTLPITRWTDLWTTLRRGPEPTASRLEWRDGTVTVRLLVEGDRAAAQATLERLETVQGIAFDRREVSATDLPRWLTLPRGASHQLRLGAPQLEQPSGVAFPAIGWQSIERAAGEPATEPPFRLGAMSERVRGEWDRLGLLWTGSGGLLR